MPQMVMEQSLLTALAGTGDARGYKQWQDADRHVKKGSKAFAIFASCTKRIKEPGKEDRVICFGFRAISVFRIEDTEGADIPIGNPELDAWIAELPLTQHPRRGGSDRSQRVGRASVATALPPDLTEPFWPGIGFCALGGDAPEIDPRSGPSVTCGHSSMEPLDGTRTGSRLCPTGIR